MGMFDEYEPARLVCPFCRRELRRWQGKDGPCALLVFREGHGAPVDQARDDPFRLEDVSGIRLREGMHEIYGGCCVRWRARIAVEGGVWRSSRLVYVPPYEAQSYDLTRAWSEALRVLAGAPAAVVRCPECGEADLETHDERVDGAPFRYVSCPRCRACDGIAPDRYHRRESL